jgi:hypothetical protein
VLEHVKMMPLARKFHEMMGRNCAPTATPRCAQERLNQTHAVPLADEPQQEHDTASHQRRLRKVARTRSVFRAPKFCATIGAMATAFGHSRQKDRLHHARTDAEACVRPAAPKSRMIQKR